MTPAKLKQCMGILQAWPAGQGQEWNDYTVQMYGAVIAKWDDGCAARVFDEAFRRHKWRPFPADLLALAVEIASPIPSEPDCYAEIIHKAAKVGLYGRPDPARPRTVFLPGAPPMSHTIVAQVVAKCGGWEMICTGEANLQEGLRKQVRAAYEQTAQKWQREVGRQLQIPVSQRDRKYFPAYVPFSDAAMLPDVEGQTVSLLPAPEPARSMLSDADAKVFLQKCRVKIKELPGGAAESQRGTLGSAERKQIEQELRERQAANEAKRKDMSDAVSA